MKRFALLLVGLLTIVICAGCLHEESYPITGTWEEISTSHFMVTYCNDADPGCMEPFTGTVLYDKETDEIFFPSHKRVG